MLNNIIKILVIFILCGFLLAFCTPFIIGVVSGYMKATGKM